MFILSNSNHCESFSSHLKAKRILGNFIFSVIVATFQVQLVNKKVSQNAMELRRGTSNELSLHRLGP